MTTCSAIQNIIGFPYHSKIFYPKLSRPGPKNKKIGFLNFSKAHFIKPMYHISLEVRVSHLSNKCTLLFAHRSAPPVAVKYSKSLTLISATHRQARLHFHNSVLSTHLCLHFSPLFLSQASHQISTSCLQSDTSHHLLIHCPCHGGHHGPPQCPWDCPSKEALESVFLSGRKDKDRSQI